MVSGLGGFGCSDGANKMKPWPTCTVRMRDGSTEKGQVAHIGATHTTVRFICEPTLVASPWGKQLTNFSYRDIPNEYVDIEDQTESEHPVIRALRWMAKNTTSEMHQRTNKIAREIIERVLGKK